MNEVTCKCGNVEIRATHRKNIVCWECQMKRRAAANKRNNKLRYNTENK